MEREDPAGGGGSRQAGKPGRMGDWERKSLSGRMGGWERKILPGGWDLEQMKEDLEQCYKWENE